MRFKFIILSFVLIGVLACKKDKSDDYSTLIIGKWEARTLTSVVTNEKGERVPNLELNEDYDRFENRPFKHFKSDGTAVSQDYDVGGSTKHPLLSKWSIKADVLTLEFHMEDDEEKSEDAEPIVGVSKMNITIVNDVLTTVVHNNFDYEGGYIKIITTTVWRRVK